MKTVILTGGGTAGHVMPNIALLPELKKCFDKIVYVGAAGGMEERIAKQNGLEFRAVPTVRFSRSNLLSDLKIPFALASCVNAAEELIDKLEPDCVFSKGGYVSLPITLAAKKRKIPYVVHESDSSIGLANRLVAGKAAYFLSAAPLKRAVTVGNPLRDRIFSGDGSSIRARFKSPLPILLVLGGSTGAAAINSCVYKALPTLTKRYNVLHIAGKTMDESVACDNYIQLAFADDIWDYYACADLVVSRAGAIASAELLALKKRVLFIPLPKGASRGDQLENAALYEKNGYSLTLDQRELSPFRLKKSLIALEKADLSPFPYDRATPRNIVSYIKKAAKFAD